MSLFDIGSARGALTSHGVVGIKVRLTGTGRHDLRILADYCESLLPDPEDMTARRYRSFASVRTIRRNGRLQLLDRNTGRYRQTSRYNPDANGKIRQFSQIPRRIVLLPTVARLIGASIASASHCGPVAIVNIHILRFTPDPVAAPLTSPHGFHKDGERIVTVVLLGRENVAGDVVNVVSNNGRLRFSKTLKKPGDGYILDDFLVWHELAPTGRRVADKPAWRDIILLDVLAPYPGRYHRQFIHRKAPPIASAYDSGLNSMR